MTGVQTCALPISADKTQVGIQITFLKDGQKRYLSMIQPWGKDGIWVPAEAKEGKR